MRIIREKLEKATDAQFKLLKKQIDSDPEAKRLLTTPMENIPQYKWLYHELYNDLEKKYSISVRKMSLLELLQSLERLIILMFSKAGSTFTGFLAYNEDGAEIKAIKTASFKDVKLRSNTVLASDLINFIEREIQRRTRITWLAHKENKEVVDQYDTLLKAKKFNWSKATEEKLFWRYTILNKGD